MLNTSKYKYILHTLIFGELWVFDSRIEYKTTPCLASIIEVGRTIQVYNVPRVVKFILAKSKKKFGQK